MSWKKRFIKYKEERNTDNEAISLIVGNGADSIRTVTASDKTFPRWLKLAIHQHEEDQKIINKLVKQLKVKK